MFYHVQVGVTAGTSWLEENKTREDALFGFVCPFVNEEVTYFQEKIFNMSSFGYLKVIETQKAVHPGWPIKRDNFITNGKLQSTNYFRALRNSLEKNGKDVTRQLYGEAITLIDNKEYKDLRKQIVDSNKSRYAFFICPFGNSDIERIYHRIIKREVRRHNFNIERANDISHTGAITDQILKAIARSQFVVADLTEEMPNCYYELGYAHSLAKPVIIMAKTGTRRHFDISHYKWNHWSTDKEVKELFHKELLAVLGGLGIV